MEDFPRPILHLPHRPTAPGCATALETLDTPDLSRHKIADAQKDEVERADTSSVGAQRTTAGSLLTTRAASGELPAIGIVGAA